MSCIDVTCFHRYQVGDQLVCWLHCLLEKLDDDLIELLLQRGVTPEELLYVNLSLRN